MSAGSSNTHEDETQPLLEGRVEDEETTRSSQSWLRKPSVPWILIPITLLTTALGGMNPSKQILFLDLICRDAAGDPHADRQHDCRSPTVSSRYAILILWTALLSGLLLIFTVPRLCALSDTRGRKLPLLIAIAGILASETITLFAAIFRETFPTYLLVLGAGLEGVTGYVLVTTSVAGSYLRDCTSEKSRSTAFALLYGCFAVGNTVGPWLGGLMAEKTGAVGVFGTVLGIHAFVLAFIWLLVPESLPQQARTQDARYPREATRCCNFTLEPFSSSPTIRRNILLLAIIDAIIFGVGLGSASIVPFTFIKFGWREIDLGHLMTVSHGTSIIANFILLPLLARFFQTKTATPCSKFDITLIRTTLLITALGYIGYAISPTEALVLFSSAVVWLGSISAPVVQSSLTKHVPVEKTGQLLGVIGQLHAVGRILFPVVFDLVYSWTAGTVPGLVFVLLAVVLVGGVGVSLGLWTGEQESGVDEATVQEEAT